MPSSCAVADCRSSKKTKTERGSALVYHRFPRDKNLRKVWITKCRRADVFNVNNATICSDHFLPDDYTRDLRNELLQLPTRKRLKNSAVPSIFPSRQSNLAKITESSRELRAKKRDVKKTVTEILKSSLSSECNNAAEESESVDNGPIKCESVVYPETILKTEDETAAAEVPQEDCNGPKFVLTIHCTKCTEAGVQIHKLEEKLKLSEYLRECQRREILRLNSVIEAMKEKLRHAEKKNQPPGIFGL